MRASGSARLFWAAVGPTQLDTDRECLGLDTGVLVIFDRRVDAADIAERTVFDPVTFPAGHGLTLLGA